MLSSQGDLTIFSQGDLIGKTTGQNFLTVWFCQQWVGGKFLSLIVIIPSHHLHHILLLCVQDVQTLVSAIMVLHIIPHSTTL